MEEIEIEKRYKLPVEEAERLCDGVEGFIVADYYVPNETTHKDLRVRQKGDEFCITRKRPVKEGDSMVMVENTIAIDASEFDALTNGIKTSVVKRRYNVPLGKVVAEIGIFEGRHEGLAILEVEFASEAEAKAWNEVKDTWQDVTNDKSYAGGKLAEWE